MRMYPNRRAAIGSIVFLAHCLAALPHANAQATSSVPFVGCASDGQVGPRKAAHRKPKVLALSPELASQLAYYQAQEGSGVLAPRGWYCFSTYGSNGGSLFVAPQLIESKLMFSENGRDFPGQWSRYQTLSVEPRDGLKSPRSSLVSSRLTKLL